MSSEQSVSYRDLTETVSKLQSGELKVQEFVAEAIERTKSANSKINAIVHFDEEMVRRQVTDIEKIPANSRGKFPLFGVPITVKDNIATKDLPTTCASQILKGFVTHYDSTAVARLRDAGAIIFGKTNCDEFAMGSSTENSTYGPTKNPWNPKCVPGGTSGGSAAAVASGMGCISLGSDTGGSVRQPAGFCGVVGFKPSYGAISRFGLVAHGSSLDQIGILSRQVNECRLTFGVVAGSDAHDMTSIASLKENDLSAKKPRIAYLELTTNSCHPDVVSTYAASVKQLEKQAEVIEPIKFDFLKIAVPLYYVISTAEAASNLSRYDTLRYGNGVTTESDPIAAARTANLGIETKRRILLGSFVLSEGYFDQYYTKAIQIRAWLKQEFARIFAKYDVIALPTSPTPAFEIGSKVEDPIQMYLSDIFTTLANLIGVPAISLPAGFSSSGLPIGIQLMTRWNADYFLLAVAETFERQSRWYERSQPKLH